MFCLNLMRIALELADENKAYEGLATKFFQHYIYIGAAMKNMGGRNYSLWDEDDGFFYDVLRYPDGSFNKFRVRSLVGHHPALRRRKRLETGLASRTFQEFKTNFEWFVKNRQRTRPDSCCHSWNGRQGSLRADHRRRKPVAADARASAAIRTNSSPITASAACRSTTSSIRSSSGTARCTTSRPSPTTRSKAATPTGAARSGSRLHS